MDVKFTPAELEIVKEINRAQARGLIDLMVVFMNVLEAMCLRRGVWIYE